MLDYIELNNLLTDIEAEVSAAGCHGFLCGQICGYSIPPDELWQEFIDAQSNNDILVNECYREIKILLSDIIDNIQSTDIDFQLMLPGDDYSLADRVDALAEWCHGFLLGYGISSGEQAPAVTAGCQEILEDFSKICRVGVEEENDEEDEQALVELIEYVRMGTILIYEDLSAWNMMTARPEVLH